MPSMFQALFQAMGIWAVHKIALSAHILERRCTVTQTHKKGDVWGAMEKMK